VASAHLAKIETPPEAAPAAPLFPDPLSTLGEAESALIAEALRRAEGNQGVAAGMLDLSRQALNKRLSRSN
jgi:DNA-binding NtrC family response regulator